MPEPLLRPYRGMTRGAARRNRFLMATDGCWDARSHFVCCGEGDIHTISLGGDLVDLRIVPPFFESSPCLLGGRTRTAGGEMFYHFLHLFFECVFSALLSFAFNGCATAATSQSVAVRLLLWFPSVVRFLFFVKSLF